MYLWAHSWCPDIISRAAKEDGAAASKRERKKRRHLRKKFYHVVLYPKLVPLVLEHFGRWARVKMNKWAL